MDLPTAPDPLLGRPWEFKANDDPNWVPSYDEYMSEGYGLDTPPQTDESDDSNVLTEDVPAEDPPRPKSSIWDVAKEMDAQRRANNKPYSDQSCGKPVVQNVRAPIVAATIEDARRHPPTHLSVLFSTIQY